jgi:hypothetical protein
MSNLYYFCRGIEATLVCASLLIAFTYCTRKG